MLERAFALSYFLKVRKLTMITYCGVCGFAVNYDTTTPLEYYEAIHFHRNSLCHNFAFELAEIEKDEFVYVWASFCEEHKNLFVEGKSTFSAVKFRPCGYDVCINDATRSGYVKVSCNGL